MKLTKIIIKPDGEPTIMGFPSQAEIDALPTKDGKPDITKLPSETAKNIILKVLNFTKPKDTQEGMAVMRLAKDVREGGDELKLDLDLQWLLIDTLKDNIYREIEENGQKKARGIYNGWAIAQVLEELGEQYESPIKTQVGGAALYHPTIKTTNIKKNQ